MSVLLLVIRPPVSDSRITGTSVFLHVNDAFLVCVVMTYKSVEAKSGSRLKTAALELKSCLVDDFSPQSRSRSQENP